MQKNMIGLMLFIVMSMWLSASLVAANGTERVAVYCGSVQSWLDEMNALCLGSDGNRIDHLIEESSGMEDLHIYNCSLFLFYFYFFFCKNRTNICYY